MFFVNVLLAGDQQFVRQGIRALLERDGLKVVGEAANGQEAVRLAATLLPEVAVLDVAMPALNGMEAPREIARVSSRTKIILLSMHTDCRCILEGLRCGVKGFVLKTHATQDLVRAIREVARGRTYLSPVVSEAVLEAYQAKSDVSPDPLSARERQTLQLIAEGKTTRQVAATLDISVKTAETYRTRIMEKLDLHGTANLVRYAVRRGIVQP